MKPFFEINHPAHIHLFRNLNSELQKIGINSIFTVKDEKGIKKLCCFYNLNFKTLGKKRNGLVQKYLWQLVYLFRSINFVWKHRINLGLGVSMNLPLVSRFTKMHSISFDDDDMAVTPVFSKYANKANVVLTPSSLSFENRGSHHFTYPGYHELAYLHPNRFKPDKSVLKILGVDENETWFFVRFNAFKAHHDIGEKGMNFDLKKMLVQKLEGYGKVFISAEGTIDEQFKHLKLPNHPELIHSFLYYADLYVGESQTMTTEAAVLGTPALKCNSFAGRLSIPNELEKEYGLCYSYLPEQFDKLMSKIDELLLNDNLKDEWGGKLQNMLEDKIDVTAFLVWFVKNYPESVEKLKQDPSYANSFK